MLPHAQMESIRNAAVTGGAGTGHSITSVTSSGTVIRCSLPAFRIRLSSREADLSTCGQPLRLSQSQAIQTGRLSKIAQTAIAIGPSSPAKTEAATVTAPSPAPASQAALR